MGWVIEVSDVGQVASAPPEADKLVQGKAVIVIEKLITSDLLT